MNEGNWTATGLTYFSLDLMLTPDAQKRFEVTFDPHHQNKNSASGLFVVSEVLNALFTSWHVLVDVGETLNVRWHEPVPLAEKLTFSGTHWDRGSRRMTHGLVRLHGRPLVEINTSHFMVMESEQE